MTSTKSSTRTFLEGARKIGLKRGRMEMLTSLLGYQTLKKHSQRQQKNLEAEEKSVRANAWGATEAGDEMPGDNTVLGDVFHTTAPREKNGLLPLITGLAIGAATVGVPAVGAGGYFLSQLLDKQDVVVPDSTDETVNLGLGKLDELLKK